MMRVRAPARKFLKTVTSYFCVLGAWLASPAQTASAPESGNTVATYRIAGTIANKVDGNPLGRARVMVRDVKDAKKFESVITAEDGKFQFTGVPPGKYSLTGAKRGFIAGSYDQHGVFSTAIVTGAGVDTENLILKILPNAMISGRVLDESGEPVRHAQVTLYLDDHAQGIKKIHMFRNSMTDDLGAYELTGLAAGTYYLAANAKPWYAVHPPAESIPAHGENTSAETADRSLDVAYPLTYYADVTDSDDATPISIQGGDHVQLDVHLNPVPALRLVVHLPDGRNAVWLEQATFDNSTYLQARPAQTSPGVWEITGVPEGRYNVHIQGTGSNPSLEMHGVELTKDGEEIDTSSAQALSMVKVSVEVAGGATRPKGVGVGLRSGGGTLDRWQQFDRNGIAEIDQVPAGRYEVTVAGPGKVYSIAKMSAEGTEISGRTINLAAGSSLALSLMLMGDRAERTVLEGTVKRAGKPCAGAMVVLVPRNPGENRDLFRRDQSDLDGSFALPDVSTGVYTVLAIENAWDLNWAEPDVIGGYLSHGQRVEVGNHTGHPVKLADIEVQPR